MGWYVANSPIYEAFYDQLRAVNLKLPKEARIRVILGPRDYQKAGVTAIAAQQLFGSGVKLRPGQNIEYIITDSESAVPNDRVRAFALWEGWLGYDRKSTPPCSMRRSSRSNWSPPKFHSKTVLMSLRLAKTGWTLRFSPA